MQLKLRVGYINENLEVTLYLLKDTDPQILSNILFLVVKFIYLKYEIEKFLSWEIALSKGREI